MQSMVVAVESVLQQPIPEVIIFTFLGQLKSQSISHFVPQMPRYVVPYTCVVSKELKFMSVVSDEIRPDNNISSSV